MHLPRRLHLRKAAKNKAGRKRSLQRGVPFLGSPDPDAVIGLVVGLGNPGRKYSRTRHNYGRMAAEAVIARSEVIATGKWPDGRLSLVSSRGRRFLVLIPETYMNLSGRAVSRTMERYKLEHGRVLVLHDDIDLPPGEIRVKLGGGTAGHRGLASIVQETGDNGFYRIRIGVGRPPDGVDPADYVLSPADGGRDCVAGEAVGPAAEEAIGLATGAKDGG